MSLNAYSRQTERRSRKPLNPIVRALIGEAHVIYGPPMAGKSTLAAYISKMLREALGKPVKYYAIDSNLRGTEWGHKLKSISNAEWVEVKVPRALPWMLDNTDWSKYSGVVIDSLTGVFEYVVETFGDILDPRINLMLSRFASVLTKKMADIAHEHKILALMISHSAAIFTGDFYGEKDRPAFAERSLKNVDGVAKLFVRVIKEKNGVEKEIRIIKWLIHRNPNSTLRRKEIRVEEIIGEEVS